MNPVRFLLGLVLGLGLAGGLACFDPPTPACAFSCKRAPNSCPENYTCGGDGWCHEMGSEATACADPPADASAD